MRISKVLPASSLRAVDRARSRRFLSITGPPTAEYVRRHGLEVIHGPFAGMRYLEGLERTSGDLVAKLLGTYERELHGALAEWIAARPAHVIDVGCAEGFYAVGLARAMPQALMHAFDIDPIARQRCAAMAQLNGVNDRVQIEGECAPASLAGFPERDVVLLSDCEGAELALLDPDLAPNLRSWPMLVELHDFIDPSITDTICRRFAETHEVELIRGEDRIADLLPEIDFMSARERAAVLSERRPGPMRWARLWPRAPE